MQTYSIGQRLIAHLLLGGVLLQSCTNPTISPNIPVANSQPKSISPISPQSIQSNDFPAYSNTSSEDSPTVLFLDTYPTNLPETEKEKFNTTIAPLLQERLVPMPLSVQEEVVHYFQQGGSFRLPVLQSTEVEDWVSESLLLDITQQAHVQGQEIGALHFKKQINDLRAYYPGTDLHELLYNLRARQAASQLNLVTLCQVTTYVTGIPLQQALELIQAADTHWLVNLRKAWINNQVQTLTHFSAIQQQQIQRQLNQCNWKPELIIAFLAGVRVEKEWQQIANFLDFLGKNPAQEANIVAAINHHTPQAEAHPIKAWQHYIACELLKSKLAFLATNHASVVAKQLATLLDRAWIYEELNKTLDILFKKQPVYTDEDAQKLIIGIDLLIEFGIQDTSTLVQALQVLQEKPTSEWGKAIHKLVIAATFPSSHERSVEEIINYIVAKSPHTSFANSQEALQKAYQDLQDIYQSPSKLLATSKNCISHWQIHEVKQWAAHVKGNKAIDFSHTATQHELAAVVRRAAELHHGYSPRATQLLSILAFLHADKGQGRLAQINTGEGKSLIVAMLAAIHALQDKKVDVVTTSPELSIPQVDIQKGFFGMLGISVDENSVYTNKRDAYKCDIVYGTTGDFQGDILRTEFLGSEIRVDRSHDVVIVDEVDSMLFDNRGYSTQLSSPIPAMNHLELILGAVWSQANLLVRRLIEKDGQAYFVMEDFEVKDGELSLFSDTPVQACLRLIEDKEAFLKTNLESQLKSLLRDLKPKEKRELQAFKEAEVSLREFGQTLATEENEAEKERKKKIYEEQSKALGQLPWAKRNKPIIEIPTHLKEFATKQIPHWAENAIEALCFRKREQHYDIKDGEIIPIDHQNTGVLQKSMVWSNGLTQFLQIKEGLRIIPESVSTNFLSTVGFFKRYGNALYGMTGTLGNQATHDFLSEVYQVDLVTIPPYKQLKITNNASSQYICKELPAIIAPTQQEWYDHIVRTVFDKTVHNQGVLVLCQYIEQAKKLADRLKQIYDPHKIVLYTGQDKFKKDKIAVGEIIIATNIAGRGTDIITLPEVEENGGMHVCITFLPANYRVELQNAGRTAREGKRGSAQLIIYHPEPTNIVELRAKRDAKELEALERAKSEVGNMLFKDSLFRRFCALEDELLPTASACEKERQYETLIQAWKEHTTQTFDPTYLKDLYENYVAKDVEKQLALILKEKAKQLSPEALDRHRQAIEPVIRHKVITKTRKEADFIKQYKESTLRLFCEKYKNNLSADVIEQFRKNKEQNIDHVSFLEKAQLKIHEREALEERWGLWLHHAFDYNEPDKEDFISLQLDQFAASIRTDDQNDTLIKNPYYYVKKGNELLYREKCESEAIANYNLAIGLDPNYSVNARYKKALALLYRQKSKEDIAEAKKELQTAKALITNFHSPHLLGLHTMVVQGGDQVKNHLSNHIKHQIDILGAQEMHIDGAIKEIDDAKEKEYDIEVVRETIPLHRIFQDAEEDHGPAIEEAKTNGLDYLYTLIAKKPIPWGDVIGLACIGIAKIVVGCVVSFYTMGAFGQGLVSSGISDLITAARTIVTREFSWEDWCLQQGIQWSISIITSGIEEVINKFKDFQDTFRNLRHLTAHNNASLGQESLQVMKDQLSLTLKKEVFSTLSTAALNWGAQKIGIDSLEKKLEKEIASAVDKFLAHNELIDKAMRVDIANKSNYWQQKLIQEAIELLHKQKSKWEQYGTGLGKGLTQYGLNKAGNWMQQHTPNVLGPHASSILTGAYQTYNIVESLAEIEEMTGKFLQEFQKEITKKYQSHIETAAKKLAEQQKQEEKQRTQEATKQQEQLTQAPTSQVLVKPEKPFQQGEIAVPKLEPGTRFNSKEVVIASTHQYYSASNKKKISRDLTKSIHAKMVNKIQGEVVHPISSTVSHIGIEHITKAETEAVAAMAMKLRVKSNTHNLNKELNPTTKKTSTKKLPKKRHQWSPAAKKALHDLRKDGKGNVSHLGAVAHELGSPIIVIDEQGQELDRVDGKDLSGEPIVLIYTNKNGIGHWEAKNPRSESGLNLGPNDCLFEAALSGSQSEMTIQEFRDQLADYLETQPALTEELVENVNWLQLYRQEAFLEGGSSTTPLPSMGNILTLTGIDLKNLPTREQLEKEVQKLVKECEQNPAFKKLQESYIKTKEQLKQDPNNTSLQATKTQLEEKLSTNPLYQQYIKLGLQAAQLRKSEVDLADQEQFAAMLSNGVVLSAKLNESSKHQREADAIKQGCLTLLRGLFNQPNTPPLQRKASAFGKGGVQSVKDTGESFISAVKFLDKLYDKIAESLVTGEDKVGFKEGMIKAKDFYQKLVDEVKQDWENREEYQERMQAAKAIKQQVQAYELAFNAEEYHLKHAKDAGYVSTEALQWAFGGEVVKVVGKGLQVTAKGLGELGEGVKILKEGQQALKQGEAVLEQFDKFPNAARKFGKHAHEFTSIPDVNAYYNKAVNLAESKVEGVIHGFTSKEGWVFRFNSETGEFLTIHPEGYIETFFRPERSIEYYLKQLETYGK